MATKLHVILAYINKNIMSGRGSDKNIQVVGEFRPNLVESAEKLVRSRLGCLMLQIKIQDAQLK